MSWCQFLKTAFFSIQFDQSFVVFLFLSGVDVSVTDGIGANQCSPTLFLQGFLSLFVR